MKLTNTKLISQLELVKQDLKSFPQIEIMTFASMAMILIFQP